MDSGEIDNAVVAKDRTRKRETRIDWSTLPGFEADYRTRRLRTPPWLTERQRRAIEGFYATCPRGYHVNHIVPFSRSRVAGLHVLENLQYLAGSPNLRKDYRLRVTKEEAMNLVRLGMAVRWIDVREDGSVNWAPYRPMPIAFSS